MTKSWCRALMFLAAVSTARAEPVPSQEDCHCGEGAVEPEWSIHPAAWGGLAALEPTPVILSSIQLDWSADGAPQSSYSATMWLRARYTFQNPGPARVERVGVRVAWASGHDFRQHGAPPVREVAPPSLKLDGRPFACALERAAWRPWGPYRPTADGAEAWCVGTLALPEGPSTHVLEQLDGPVSPARLWSTFRYGFEAESTWAGPVETVEARLPLSRVKNLPLVVSPRGFQVQDGSLRWRLGRNAAAQLPPILVGLIPCEPPAPKPRAANLGYAMSASSVLPPDGPHRYDADRALDGDGGTAWCEGVPGPGIGQHLEVRPRLDPALAAGCRLQGFAVIPGVALSKALWLANNRAVRLRISSCTHPEDGVDIDLEHLPAQGGRTRRFPDDPRSGSDPARFELEGDALYGPPPARVDALQRERECFRLTVLGVKRGKVDDTCIGEFVPLLTCP